MNLKPGGKTHTMRTIYKLPLSVYVFLAAELWYGVSFPK